MNDKAGIIATPHDVTGPRTQLGTMFAVMAAVLAVITPIPGLMVLGTTEFAQDFTSGTRTADHSGLYASAIMALLTGLVALAATVVGRGGSRAVGVAILAAPVACFLILR